jgi:hypothetical protein
MTDFNSSTPEPGTLCSSISRSSDEQLFGTATHARVWFILEYPQVYGSKAFEDSDLPGLVKTHLSSLLKGIPDARVQLIKREASPFPRQISFFIGLTSEVGPSLYQFQISDYSELLELDIRQIVNNSDGYAKYRRKEPLYLVCTNGRRDPCCTKYGLSFYTTLSTQEPEATWQTSHVGGHRFAANLVCFPHGLFYGRLEEADVPTVLDSYRRDEFYLEKYRGRSCFTGPIQAAEYFLHIQTGLKRISAYTLESEVAKAENRWEVTFKEAQTGQNHRLFLVGVPSEFTIRQSCRDLEKMNVMQFRLEDFR